MYGRNVLLKRGSVPVSQELFYYIEELVATGMPMSHALRASGIPLFEAVPWGTSLALFYETEQDLIDTCVGYFAAGLQAREMCVWLLVGSVTVETARRGLQDIVPDIARHEAAGGITLLSRDEVAGAERALDASRVIEHWNHSLKRAREHGYEGLRLASNAWSATGEWQQYYAFQQELVAALSGRSILALGTYDLGARRAVEVLDVVRLHHLTVARRRGDWQFMETPELTQANARIQRLNDALAIMSAPFPGQDLLTERERGVLAQMVTGASSKEIAREFGVSPRTVDFHRSNILQKLGARNTADAIRVVLHHE
ncbi:MAG: MEDS domain-containing protein [Pseudolabrys sp.]